MLWACGAITLTQPLSEGVEKGVEKNKRGKIINILPLSLVGMTGFEPATPRRPDVYSNRAELHPEIATGKVCCAVWGFLHPPPFKSSERET